MSLQRKTLAEMLTFTRAGTATYFGSDGLLKTAAANEPRFDYDPVTLQPRGLLLEGSRTNAIIHSNDYNNAGWNKNVSGSLTLTSNAHAGLDGTLTADTFATTAASAGVFRTNVHTGLSVGSMVTMTFLVKPLTGYCKVRIGYDGTAFTTAAKGVFDLIAGTSTAFGAATTRTMRLLPSGYWLITITAAATAAGAADVSIYSHDATAQTFAADHLQSELGAFGTSIIPTTSAAVTRAADSVVMTGTQFSDWFNPVEGTFVVDFITITNGLNNTGGNDFEFLYDLDTSAAPTAGHTLIASAAYGPGVRAITAVGGVNQTEIQTAATLGIGATIRHAYAYKANDFAGSLNGGTVQTDASGTLPTPNRMAIGSQNAGGSGHFDGHIRRIRYWPNRLSNALLQEATA